MYKAWGFVRQTAIKAYLAAANAVYGITDGKKPSLLYCKADESHRIGTDVKIISQDDYSTTIAKVDKNGNPTDEDFVIVTSTDLHFSDDNAQNRKIVEYFTRHIKEVKPDLVIPFKLDKKAAKEALKKHFRGKKFVPKAFLAENKLDEVKGVYVPHWLFSCDAVVNATYQAEKYKHWSDSKNEYTETTAYNVYRSGSIGFDNVPVDGSTKMPDDLMESIEPFNLNEAVPFNTAYLAGYLADKYDVDVNQSMGRANERIQASALDAFEDTVEGYNAVTPMQAAMQVANGSYKYALYPVWILNVKWKGQNHTFAMNGQTGKFVGNIPTEEKKAKLIGGLGGAAVGALIYIIINIISSL